MNPYQSPAEIEEEEEEPSKGYTPPEFVRMVSFGCMVPSAIVLCWADKLKWCIFRWPCQILGFLVPFAVYIPLIMALTQGFVSARLYLKDKIPLAEPQFWEVYLAILPVSICFYVLAFVFGKWMYQTRLGAYIRKTTFDPK